MDYPKSVPNVGLVNGKFVDENTSTGQVGSLIPATWGSAVTDEILNVIMSGGVAPDENQNDQLLLAIKEIIKDNIPPEKIRTTLAEYGITDAYTKTKVYTKEEINELLKNATALPVGAMVPFPVGVVPPGYLEVDNRLFKDDVYPDLAAYLAKKFNLAGDAADYTRLPESRGEFFRGWDHGRGVDAGRIVGSSQLDQMQGHLHAPPKNASAYASFGSGGSALAAGNGIINPNATGSPVSDGVNGEPRAGAETRPRNLAVMWCIKAWNAPINQGNIDIAALSRLVAQATESSQGTAKVATPAQINAGTDDAVFVTPKKLRLGFQFLPSAIGYIAFPSWMGGLIIQWGSISVPQDATAVATMATAFQVANFWESATGSINRITGGTTQSATNVTARTLQTLTIANDDAAQVVRWLAVGY
ncbi:tail fiber protein [Pseudomonas lurida]|uniref:tail fiber protein n=1 Tax=Pseudomonas lurida TaxID=244566 RepID=UPI001F3CC26C|nr:tail fiber protein [Pseudomonas lurida]MCF5025127.1 hypothetical protein [Pseudomonas lurida]MCF5308304.1 hypothetical protein [Pseudomonas lurida]